MLKRGVGGLIVCMVLGACSRQDMSADLAAIQDVNAALLGALNAGDWQRLNELTAEDYVSIIGGRAVQGIENHRVGNRRFLEQWHDEEAWLPDATVIDGDLAVQRGSFTMTLTPRQGAGEARDLTGTYLHVYQRQTDGGWALVQAMAGTIDD